METVEINCLGYKVIGDVYGPDNTDGPLVLQLIGRTSNRKKQHYVDFSERLVNEQDATSVIFDYSGHGDSPFNIESVAPAEQFVEVVNVFDWMTEKFPSREIVVIGSSYGGYMATQLTKYRKFDKLILRAPAMYRPQDFYTKMRDEDRDTTMKFRRDDTALASHPLLMRARNFVGDVLLITHENDEHIPKETSDAYRDAFGAKEVVEVGITHSLDDATQEQIDKYFEDIYLWLTKEN